MLQQQYKLFIQLQVLSLIQLSGRGEEGPCLASGCANEVLRAMHNNVVSNVDFSTSDTEKITGFLLLFPEQHFYCKDLQCSADDAL
jgi:hypothetical protein